MKKSGVVKAIIGLGAGFVPFTAAAQAGDISVSASVDLVSEYVFRGTSLEEAAIQPGFEVASGGFYVGVWVSEGLENNAQGGGETDYYGGFGWDLSETIAADVGVTRYSYEGTTADTTEIYGGLSFDVAFAPSLYVYYDFDLETTTVQGAVGHSFGLSETMSFDTGLTLWYISPDSGGEVLNGDIAAGLAASLGGPVSAHLTAHYAFAEDDGLDFADGGTEDDLFWVGIGLSVE